MTTFATRDLAGWGRFPVQSCRVARPEKRRDLLEAAGSDQVADIIARGLGRSYGDPALNADSGVVLTEKLNRYIDFDPVSGLLYAESGVSLDDIAQTFVPRGYFLPVTPGTKFVTLGGAIAHDVHGKNHHIDGSFSNFVDEFDLLTASGEILTCSREKHPEAFWTTTAGLGLTGVILSAKIRLVPVESAYINASYQRTAGVEETLDEFAKDAETKYSVAWIDCLATGASLGRSIVIRGEHASADDVAPSVEPLSLVPKKKKSVPLEFPNFALNPMSVKAFNGFYYAAHQNGKSLVGLEPFFWPLDAVSGWNKIYGARGFIQYHCALPLETSRVGLVKLLEKISTSGRAPFLAVLKVKGPENQAPLGFPLLGHSLALDIPNAPGAEDFARELDQIVIEHGGRNYLAKDSVMTPESVRAMYPRLSEWEEARHRLDPEGRFQSSMSKRLRIGASAGGAA